MAFEQINRGTTANDGTGDNLREAFRKVNDNFDKTLEEVTTAGVERAYIINADGSQGTKATSEFKDVLEFANLAAFPATGESGKIYVALDTNFTYRWSGSVYVQIGGSSTKEIRAFYPSWNFTTINTWRSWNLNTSNMLVIDANQSLGTGVTPSSFTDSNYLLIQGMKKLKKVTWNCRNPGSIGTQSFELYIRSITFANNTARGNETNAQVLVQELTTIQNISANGYKDNFVISNHALGAITGIQIAYRQTTGTVSVIQGVQLILEFE
jgi:hypothetical protein